MKRWANCQGQTCYGTSFTASGSLELQRAFKWIESTGVQWAVKQTVEQVVCSRFSSLANSFSTQIAHALHTGLSLSRHNKNPTTFPDKTAGNMSNKRMPINPNMKNESHHSMNEVQVSYFVVLTQSNIPDYTIPWPFHNYEPFSGLCLDLIQILWYFQVSRACVYR